MLKRNKILILFVVVLCSLVFLCGSVYASDDTGNTEDSGFIYTDKYGTVFNLPVYPEELKEYNHYVVIKTTINNTFYLLPFNETFEVVDNNGSTFNVLLDGQNFYNFFWRCEFDGSTPDSWDCIDNTTGFRFSLTNNPHYVVDSCSCSSFNQSDLQDAIDNKDSFFLNRQEVLVPIMEKAPLAKVVEEILEILPVVLVVIVALIALRKAIAFLIQTLRQA